MWFQGNLGGNKILCRKTFQTCEAKSKQKNNSEVLKKLGVINFTLFKEIWLQISRVQNLVKTESNFYFGDINKIIFKDLRCSKNKLGFMYLPSSK